MGLAKCQVLDMHFEYRKEAGKGKARMIFAQNDPRGLQLMVNKIRTS